MMKVTITDRGAGKNYSFSTVTVEISDNCRQCGGPRGKPVLFRYCEDGDFYYVHNWNNPCGHVDLYPDILEEAAQLKTQGDE